MPNMLIRHRVNDFEKWKPAFDSHRAAREAAGITDLHVWRNVYDSNEVVILFNIEDMTRANAFAGSTDLRERMKAAGVEGEPDIVFLDGD